MERPPSKSTVKDPARTESVSSIVGTIVSEFEPSMGSPDRVRSACSRLRDRIGDPPAPPEMETLAPLLPLTSKRMGAVLRPLFDFMEETAWRAADPWPWLQSMLSSNDRDLVRRALKSALKLAETGLLSVDLRVARFFARRIEATGGPLSETDCLAGVKDVVALSSFQSEGVDPLVELFLNGEEIALRRLAARLMDLEGAPPMEDLARKFLGTGPHRFLAPYLAYTRATHMDLCRLAPDPGKPPPCLESLKEAEAACGERTLREALAALGWEAVNIGLEIRKCVKVRVGEAFPVTCSPGEARLFDGLEGVDCSEELTLFVGRGALPFSDPEKPGEAGLIARFRSYNLAHAEFLSHVLVTSPLTEEKVQKILEVMERIVSDFHALFSSLASESAILMEVFGRLREEILSGLRNEAGRSQLSAELSRLVQLFEDPAALGEVRTLHGLKRYLHQRGLGLVSRLAGSTRVADRTVSLAVASKEGVFAPARRIRYVEFEPEEGEDAGIPYPVGAAVDGFARQMIHGQEEFPEVKIFCYGNEVHYYLSFVNHPAFLRIDYSPPLKGGMIDLEYYGVSKYELDRHPDPSLGGIRAFLSRLGFDCGVEDTRVKARFDKERAVDLGEICRKAEALFRLVPYLMTIDWVLGALDLPTKSRLAAGKAWAEFFEVWGALPLKRLLSRGGKEMLTGAEQVSRDDRGASRSEELCRLDGRFALPAEFVSRLKSSLLRKGLRTLPLSEGSGMRVAGQLDLERLLFIPLREAVARGEIRETAAGFLPASAERFRREGAAERFAEILASGSEAVVASASLARLVAPLEPILRFRTTGRLNGHEVQAASLPLMGASLGLHVLREGTGMIFLACFSRGETLFRSRQAPSLSWQSNGRLDLADFLRELRRANYLAPGMTSIRQGGDPGEAESILARFRKENRVGDAASFPGERILTGLKASPGRAVGRVVFGVEKRSPQDLAGAILVAPSIRPQDGPFLYHAAGVVSTGGSVLSHAGLIALQLGKPALIVPGEWRTASDGEPELLYLASDCRVEEKRSHGCRVALISVAGEREHRLREGDLAVIDADEGVLKVLGQEREALAFHEAFGRLGEVSGALNRAGDPRAAIIFRGRRLRCLRRIDILLSTIADPVLARHAVHELLLSDFLSCGEGGEKVRLLNLVLRNGAVAKDVRRLLLEVFGRLQADRDALFEKVQEQMPVSNSLYEVLFLRLRLLRLRRTLEDVSGCLADCGFDTASMEDGVDRGIEETARNRLEAMRAGLEKELEGEVPAEPGLARLILRRIERLDRVLGAPPKGREALERRKEAMARSDRRKCDRLAERLTLSAEDGGMELFPLIGWKAANLAEVERFAGRGSVPGWFAATNCVLQKVLDSPLAKGADVDPSKSLRRQIEEILLSDELDNSQRSLRIGRLWEVAALPQEAVEQILAAYRRLKEAPDTGPIEEGEDSWPYVAVRSSALEEDSETAVRAGEFDTFLYIRGGKPLLDYVRRGWSGLWTRRAIHFRAMLGRASEGPSGGILVQRMVRSRVSGVLQTANVSQGNLREMVINAGLGLGEGIVSGRAPADQIVVAKEGGEAPLRFRYATNDKRLKVVFDERSGFGVALSEAASHERLRPALEYAELCDLVRRASRLEAAYGCPLDVEFALEGAQIRILQVRPVPTFAAVIEETVRDFPLRGAMGGKGPPRTG